MFEIISYILLGIMAGMLAGLFGIGGGIIVVPGLAYIFTAAGMPQTAIMHMAISTSLATVILTTLTVVIVQQRQHAIVWSMFWRLVPGMFVGVLLGTGIADLLPTQTLKIIFGIFLILVAIHLSFSKEKNSISTPHILANWFQLIIGFAIGLLAGLLGVGGGIIAVPALLRVGLSMHQATATSSACAFLLGVMGTLNLIFIGMMGWSPTGLLAGHTNYIYWPAVLGVAAASIILAPFGTILANRLSAIVLRYIFAIFLLGIGVDMLIVTKII